MDEMTARAELRNIKYARDEQLLSLYEVAERVQAVLDRSPLQPVSLSAFLLEKGHVGADLHRVMGRFATAVREAYEREHGTPPLRRLDLTDVGRRPVNAYVVDDLPLIEAAYLAVTNPQAVAS